MATWKKIITQTELDLKANIASPTFTGTVAIPNIANLETAVTANTAKVTNATHTGDVTGATSLTIADDAVTYAKMQNVSATNRILGRDTAGAGVIEEISPSSLRTMINVEDNAQANRTLDTTITDGNTANSISSDAVYDAVTLLDNEKLSLGGGTMTGDINAAANTIGFTKHEETSGTNVTVDFRDGHKADLAMTSNISGTLKLYFPAVSGNFLLVVKQDATGSRTIANYEAYESNGSTLAHNDGGTDGDIRWQGGAEPTFSTGANRRDMISFYWDATDRVCYAAYSGNFY